MVTTKSPRTYVVWQRCFDVVATAVVSAIRHTVVHTHTLAWCMCATTTLVRALCVNVQFCVVHALPIAVTNFK